MEAPPPADHDVVGRAGTVTIAVAGGAEPGEVSVHVRGTVELFIAYSDHPLPVGADVLVYRSRGHRGVDVMPDPTPR